MAQWKLHDRFFSPKKDKHPHNLTETNKRNNNKCLNVFVVNNRSLKNKLVELEYYLADKNIQLMGITEHWLSSQEADATQIANLQVKSNCSRRKCSHGGSMVLTQDNLEAVNLECCNTFSVDRLMETEIFLKKMNCILQSIDILANIIIISGDFNINCIEKNCRKEMLCDLMATLLAETTVLTISF